MLKSLLKVQQVDAGVRIENVITMAADLPMFRLSHRGKRRRVLSVRSSSASKRRRR
jgi:hypothetical protein